MAIRILISDDHPVVRQGLRVYLGLDPDLELVGEATNGEEAVRLARELKPDVILMDLLMPGMDGLAATRVIRRELPDIEVVALTSVLEDRSVSDAIQAGAIGYFLKDAHPDDLLNAIKAAAAGQVQLCPQAAATLIRTMRAPAEPEPLTDREMDVLRLLARGYSNKEMARLLYVGDATVKTHVRNILTKLGVSSRTQATLYALRAGLATLEDPVQNAASPVIGR